MTSSEIIDRLSASLDAKNDAALARALGVSPVTVSSWRRRDSTPYAICIQVAENRGVSLDWLLLGLGEMRRAPGAVAEPRGGGYTVGVAREERNLLEGGREAAGAAEQIVRWLREWWPRASEQERAWLDQHLRRTVEEYRDWRNKHET